MGRAPFVHLVQNIMQIFSTFGQTVFNMQRYFREHLFFKRAVFFQIV